MRQPDIRSQRGLSLVEVLVTMVILATGLLGLVGLQARLQILQAEAYQRAQALMLLKDMSGRISNNRNNAAEYVTTAAAPLGVGMDCSLIALSTPAERQELDFVEWCNALQGASESIGTNQVGAMVGGRGCVEDLLNGQYLVTVAWQGLAPISAPPDTVACGAGEFEEAGSVCEGDVCRRAVTTIVRIADLL